MGLGIGLSPFQQQHINTYLSSELMSVKSQSTLRRTWNQNKIIFFQEIELKMSLSPMSIHVYSDVNMLMDTSLLRDAGQTYITVWLEIKHIHTNFKVPQASWVTISS